MKNVGLALSSGGARGLSHIGVIKVLEKYDVPIAYIAGTSAGALIGGIYASGTSIKRIEDAVLSVGYKDLIKLLDPMNPTIALIKGEKLMKFISKFLSHQNIEEFEIPFACVAADLFTGRKVVFKEGNALTAIRASISYPGLLKPVFYQNQCLVDGGLIDPLPVDVVREMGAHVIIAVDVVTIPKLKKTYARNKPKLIDNLRASLRILERRITELTLEKVDGEVVIIKPQVVGIKTLDFLSPKIIEMVIRKGELATERKINEILELSKN